MFSLRNVTVGQNSGYWPWALEQCLSSITDRWPLGDCFPSFCSAELISVMRFCVCVYRRLKGLFVFPLVALWLFSPQTCLKHCYLRPDAFLHRELLNHVSSPSPEFQMRAVEKLAIASAWQVGSISVLSPCKAWASSRPLGTTAGCAPVRVRLLGHYTNAADRRGSRSHSKSWSGSFDELTPEGGEEGQREQWQLSSVCRTDTGQTGHLKRLNKQFAATHIITACVTSIPYSICSTTTCVGKSGVYSKLRTKPVSYPQNIYNIVYCIYITTFTFYTN